MIFIKENYQNFYIILIWQIYFLFSLIWGVYLIIILDFKILLISIIVILLVILPAAYISLLERQVVGIIQQRLGPVFGGGIFSLLNPILDGIKLFLRKGFDVKNFKKKYIVGLSISYTLWITMAIWSFFYFEGYNNLSILWILLILNINNFGLFFFSILIGNKYTFLSIIRLISLIISYDIIIGIILLSPCLFWSSVTLIEILNSQIFEWHFLIILPIIFLYVLVWMTEVRKVPFDTVESEAEMASDYMQEMSGLAFALLVITEYISLFFLIILFIYLFIGKVILIKFCFYIWIILITFLNLRSILPNYHFDQVINIFWKYLFPISIIILLLFKIYIYF